MTIDDWNYYGDPRVNARVPGVPTITNEDGDEIELPWKWEVCGVCNGQGTHVNPAIDAGGLSHEDLYEDPDFAEGYFSGRYDQTCNGCNGRSTVMVVDWDRLTPEQEAAYEAELRNEAYYQAEVMAERRMGA